MAAKHKSNRIKSHTLRRFVSGLFILVFAAVGSYLLTHSKAAAPDNSFYRNGATVADYSIYADTPNLNEQHTVGARFKRNYYLRFKQGGTYPQVPHHVQFYLRWYTKEVKHLQAKFDCGDFTPCVKVTTPGYSEHPSITNLIYCFEVTPEMRSQGNVRLFSTEFQQISATKQNWFDDLLYLFSGECSGYYENGPPANDANYLASSDLGNGSLGSGIVGTKPGGKNTGNDENVDGDRSQGSGTGGGSSGSTATKNGNDPNSTPSSSSQGDKDQSKLDPSPFYDGKQYQRGSESDSGLGGLFTQPRRGGLATGRYLLVALFLLATGGGYLWWKRSKDR